MVLFLSFHAVVIGRAWPKFSLFYAETLSFSITFFQNSSSNECTWSTTGKCSKDCRRTRGLFRAKSSTPQSPWSFSTWTTPKIWFPSRSSWRKAIRKKCSLRTTRKKTGCSPKCTRKQPMWQYTRFGFCIKFKKLYNNTKPL